MDEQELRAAAERAIGRGADPDKVYARLDSLLAETQGSRVQQQREEVALAADPRARSSLPPMVGGAADFLRMMGQSASMEFGDEVMGDRDYVEAIRQQNPFSAFLASLATGAVPGVPLARGGVSGFRAGAGIGALAGGTTAAGAVDGGTLLDRLAAVPRGAGVGAALGAAFPATSAVLRRAGLRGRVAGSLERNTGVRRADRARQFEDIDATTLRAKRQYDKVEEAYPSVVDEDITAFIRELRDSPAQEVRGIANRISDDEMPSVPELQTMRGKLRKKGFDDDAARLTEYMNRIPGFREADDLYAQANAAARAFDSGREAGRLGINMSGDDISRQVAGLSDADAFIFRRGQVTELLERLARREEGTADGLRQLLDAGEGTKDILRTMFPTSSSYDDFMRSLATERNVERAAAVVRRYMPWLVGAAGLGVASN